MWGLLTEIFAGKKQLDTALDSVLRCGFENRSAASTSAWIVLRGTDQSIPATTRRNQRRISREFCAGVGGGVEQAVDLFTRCAPLEQSEQTTDTE